MGMPSPTGTSQPPVSRDPSTAREPRPLSGDALQRSVHACLAEVPHLPHPGDGDTRARWHALARWAADDLALVKVLEAHHDAVAILRDLGGQAPAPGEVWAVWAAEPPHAVVHCRDGVLRGAKAWASGAGLVTHALLSVQLDDGSRALAAIDMHRPGIRIDDGAWQAVGMGAVRSGTVTLDAVPATWVCAPGAYLARPGFWHGGAGISACWHGGAIAIADALRRSGRVAGDPHAAAHLGAIDVALAGTAALLRALAVCIDEAPGESHVAEVQRVRAAVDIACTQVIERVGRALGAAPLCLDAEHAQRCADLAVFIRQSHAERDLQSIGEALHAGPAHGWWP